MGKTEERFSLRTRDPGEAKQRHAAALVEIEQRWANLKRPLQTISEREAEALARPIFHGFVAAHWDNPSEQREWDVTLGDALFEAKPLAGNPLVFSDDDLRSAQMRALVTKEYDDLVLRLGLQLDEVGLRRLQRAVASALQQGALHVQEPAIRPKGTVKSSPTASITPVSFLSLLDGWKLEKKPKPKTEYTFRGVLNEVAAHVGHSDAAKLTARELQNWKESMLRRGLSPRTIRYNKLAAVSAILRWGADNQKLTENVATKIVVSASTPKSGGRRGFTDDEAVLLLDAARRGDEPHIRWMPWICAYSGARLSEVAQLRREDFESVGDIWVFHLRPEAGSLKNRSSERTIPLHPKLVEEGLLKFVQSVKAGPIFREVKPDRFDSRGGNATKLVSRWVRALGVTDQRISPSHSWRHRFKTLARRHGMATDIANAITGHSSGNVGDAYGAFEVPALYRELIKIS